MSLPNSLALADAFNTPIATFNARYADAGKSERIDRDSTSVEPRLLVIKHEASGRSDRIIDRHLISLSEVKVDSGNVAHTMTVNLTVSVPRNTVFTTARISENIVLATALLGDGYKGILLEADTVAAILRGES